MKTYESWIGRSWEDATWCFWGGGSPARKPSKSGSPIVSTKRDRLIAPLLYHLRECRWPPLNCGSVEGCEEGCDCKIGGILHRAFLLWFTKEAFFGGRCFLNPEVTQWKGELCLAEGELLNGYQGEQSEYRRTTGSQVWRYLTRA